MEVIFSIKLFVLSSYFSINDLFIKLFPGPIFPSANIQVWGGRHSTSICTQVTVAKLRLMRWKQSLQNDYSWKGEKEAACLSRGWWCRWWCFRGWCQMKWLIYCFQRREGSSVSQQRMMVGDWDHGLLSCCSDPVVCESTKQSWWMMVCLLQQDVKK